MTDLIVGGRVRGRLDGESPEDAGRTKERLLLLLKTRGGMTTKALAGALGISVPATRTHLKSLGGLVSAENASGGIGRPAQTWRLTAAAQDRFPDTHSELTVRILESVERSLGRAGLDAVIADRFREVEHTYLAALAGVGSLAGKLRRLVALRTEEGYMAALEKTPDGWLLIENHCPICAAAAACQGFCSSELELFRTVLGDGVRVERVEYLLGGGRRCAYAISRNPAG
jgi:predicted ArsR family transcriptional regulator